MMRISQAWAIACVGALLSLALAWSVTAHIRAVETGREIILPAEGYDPRSLLSGHFAQMRYPINQAETADLTENALAGEQHRRHRRGLYVGLKADEEGAWRVTRVSEQAFSAAGVTVVRARGRNRFGDRVQLDYGIERFYAQQKEALELEEILRRRESEVRIVAALGQDRRLRIKAIIIDGHRRDMRWW